MYLTCHRLRYRSCASFERVQRWRGYDLQCCRRVCTSCESGHVPISILCCRRHWGHNADSGSKRVMRLRKKGTFLITTTTGTLTVQRLSLFSGGRSPATDVTYKDKKIGPDNHVGLCLGGVTGGKAKEFFDLYDAFAEFMEGEGKISTPILIQTAGDMSGSDGLVLNPETKKFCDQSLKSCTLTNYPTSKHHIWTETDDIRNPAMKEAFDCFAGAGVKTAQCPTVPTCGAWNYSWRNWGCKNGQMNTSTSLATCISDKAAAQNPST